ncbi:MGMT family protein [Planococcus salinarum]|uniref:MGMT family protein n=1 Tax=Planococcus salinarum TaxID=622695 RepID=UPI000E3E5B6A|nr:MGMT family protein [Planococcus salinarum]TAA73223.1 MGMT family protein [Planococcus salinarum]
MEAFTEKAIKVIRNIPPGRVMTYGQIASHAGSPRGARQVARLLHSMSAKYELPWHRVINAQGKISFQDTDNRLSQTKLLQNEGVEVCSLGKIDLKHYRHDPGHDAF